MQDLGTLVQAHEDIYRSFGVLVRELEPDDWRRPTGCPGWDVADQVAHVASLEGLLAGDPFPSDHELAVEGGHVRDDIGRFMEVLVDVRRGRTPAELVDELERAFERRWAELATYDDISAEAPSFTGDRQPLYRSLPIRVLDLYAHEQDVRRAVGRPGHTSGPAPTIVVERLGKGLGAVLPAKLERPGRVRFELTDDPEHSFEVPLADAGEGPPTRIELTVEQFVALGCGRSDAPAVDDVRVDGDRELAAAVLPACGLTP